MKIDYSEIAEKLNKFREAIISQSKLKYALGYYPNNPKSVAKGRLFRRFGFNEISLEKAVRSIFGNSKAINIRITEYGIQFSKYGEVETPTGEILRIGTGWILEPDAQFPRLTTITPR
jgi:hypothetical protein